VRGTGIGITAASSRISAAVLAVGAFVTQFLAAGATGQTLRECRRRELAEAPHSVAATVWAERRPDLRPRQWPSGCAASVARRLRSRSLELISDWWVTAVAASTSCTEAASMSEPWNDHTVRSPISLLRCTFAIL
jgi:hypothetical protein